MPLLPAEKTELLAIARTAIVNGVTGSPPPPYHPETEGIQQMCGCFVTIKMHGELRGCIGTFVSDMPLWQLVQQMAISAATKDPRFYPMKPADLAHFHLEISVLSPLQQIESIEQIQVGVHGIYLEKNFSRGVLLPQVATEQGWDRDMFLKQTCIKAGLKPTDWEQNAKISIFSADVFGE
jgi:AmmeMemoRadiSam system protein A